ncbi:MAG TPA: response regulator, partial [Candidatus Phocaeicola gallinarum]|nr:response regulator [Candidatus Phocaeicola gallinarum]
LIALGLVVGALMFYRRRLNLIYLYESEKRNRIQERELTQERLRFYTNITHELRTPLTLILGPLEDLLKSHSLVPKDKQKISVIHQSAVRLLNLINQLLEFRKAETQNRQLCVSQGNLAAVVHEIGLKYKELNRKPSVDILIETESDNMQLFFDKEVITIVLDNLISNALKYTEQGKITLMLRWKERNASKYAEISVSDTGYGIDAEALPHIFDRYYQERSEHQASGTGIGLALVKNLVNLHEAQIEVESKLNEGSIFTILLQADYVYPQALHGENMENEPHGAAAEAEDVKEESQNNKPIVLVVEDNADISEYIAESLSEEFDVRIAENGKVGLQSAVKWVPDIIVSDVMMPVMDGIEMCRKIKDNICTCHIPVILLTAKDSLSDKEAGYQYGADSYMTKPFSASLLRTRIHNLLEMRRRLVERLSGASSMEIKKTVIAENCSKLDNEFLAKLTQLIEENLSQEKVDVKYLSDKLCMSSSTLYRKMKALTGLSTNEYVRKVKMRSAEKLLLEGKYTISEIAFMVGMNGTGYFRQCFKDEFGVSPSDYVKQLKAPSSDKLC